MLIEHCLLILIGDERKKNMIAVEVIVEFSMQTTKLSTPALTLSLPPLLFANLSSIALVLYTNTMLDGSTAALGRIENKNHSEL